MVKCYRNNAPEVSYVSVGMFTPQLASNYVELRKM